MDWTYVAMDAVIEVEGDRYLVTCARVVMSETALMISYGNRTDQGLRSCGEERINLSTNPELQAIRRRGRWVEDKLKRLVEGIS